MYDTPTRRLARFELLAVAIACALVSLIQGLIEPINDDDIYHLHSIWLMAEYSIAILPNIICLGCWRF